MHEGTRRVALGPRPEAGGLVAAFELREEPVRGGTLAGLSDPDSGSHQRQELLAVGCPHHGRADGAVRARRQVDPRTVDVEHLPQRDHRDAIPIAVREIDEHVRVVPTVITEEHPPQVRHPIRQVFDPSELPRPTATEHPPRREAPARRQQRAGRVAITFEQGRDRLGQHDREGRQVEHRRAVQIGRQGADETGHGQRRTAIPETRGAEGAKPRQLTPRRPQPEHAVHVEDHAVGVAGGHREPPPYRGEPPWVWRTRRFSQRPLVPGIGRSGVPQRPTSQQICADHAERPPVRHHPRRASRSGLRRLQRIRPGAHAGTRRRPSGAGSDARPPRSRQQPRSWG